MRRSRHRLAAIDRRLEILGGLLIVYLDLDKVIKIIREEDEPKQELMRFFKLTEVQANAILDTRLRSLRELEEMELKREQKELDGGEGARSRACSAPRRRSGRRSPGRSARSARLSGPKRALGKRRTTFDDGAGHLATSTSRRRWSSASRSR